MARAERGLRRVRLFRLALRLELAKAQLAAESAHGADEARS